MEKDKIDFTLKIAQLLLAGIILPLANWVWRKRKFFIFKRMIKKQYTNNIHYTDKFDNTKVAKLLGLRIKRLDYLLENEVKYLKVPNQIDYIRLIEFTKSYFKIESEIANAYLFRGVDRNKTIDQEIKLYTEHSKKIRKLYKKKLRRYIGFRTDELIGATECKNMINNLRKKLKALKNP